MKEKLQARLQQLRDEFAGGQAQLAEIEKQRAELDVRSARVQETMLRISGAVQVLEEELADDGAAVVVEAGQTEEAAVAEAVPG